MIVFQPPENMHPPAHYEKTRELFERRALDRQGFYDAEPGQQLRHSIWQRRVRKIALGLLRKTLPSAPYCSAMDAGCGRGDFTLAVASLYPQLKEVWGCDFAANSLAIAHREAANFPHVGFARADLRNLPFAGQRFDLTICLNALHHILPEDLDRVLSQLAGITRRCMVLEIKNAENFYYRHIHKSVEDIRVHPTSVGHVAQVLGDCGFQLTERKGIFLLEFLSPIIVLQLERTGQGTP